jgi:hypothetical protein
MAPFRKVAGRFLDVHGGLRERLGMVDVAFADAFGERPYMGLETILE